MTLVSSQGASETCTDQISQHSVCVITNAMRLNLLKVKEQWQSLTPPQMSLALSASGKSKMALLYVA